MGTKIMWYVNQSLPSETGSRTGTDQYLWFMSKKFKGCGIITYSREIQKNSVVRSFLSYSMEVKRT
jgi:hypothetical protein